MNAPAGPAELIAAAQNADADRWLAAQFADAPTRMRLAALYALADEINRIPERISEPMVGEIRLAWWREAIETAVNDPDAAPRHPMLAAFVSMAPGEGMVAAAPAFDRIITARIAELDAGPFPNAAARLKFAKDTAGALAEIAAMCCDHAISDAARQTASDAGAAWGLMGLARAFAHRAQKGRPPVTIQELTDLGAKTADFAQNRALVASATTPLIAAAVAAHGNARGGRRAFPARVWPAVGYAALIPSYAAALGKTTVGPGGLRRRWILFANSITGGL